MTTFNERLMQARTIQESCFSPQTSFERAIFFSWDCSIKDCGFCYMSAHTKRATTNKPARRSTASILAEVILCKKLGWNIGFISGGINAYTHPELQELLKKIYLVYGEKVWLNVGPIPQQKLIDYLPYILGVVGSIETINPELHKKVCPSKPTAPYEKMFIDAQDLGLKNAMSFIIGMGETIDDFPLLESFVRKYAITKIHLYGLIPHHGTQFEHAQPPTSEYQAEWIARIRIAFPTINIQCGIWKDRVERIALLLTAGANTISKFSAITNFGTRAAHTIEEQARLAGRKFAGTLTKIPFVNIHQDVEQLPFNDALKHAIQTKLEEYLRTMQHSCKAICAP